MSIETSNYAGLLAEIAALSSERDALLTLYETALEGGRKATERAEAAEKRVRVLEKQLDLELCMHEADCWCDSCHVLYRKDGAS